MTAPAPQSQPVCATPPEDLILLACALDAARSVFLDATECENLGYENYADQARSEFVQLLWNDKGTFAPALRQAAQAAALQARVEELTKALEHLLNDKHTTHAVRCMKARETLAMPLEQSGSGSK